jgi:ADP-ribose pyrophosphatase
MSPRPPLLVTARFRVEEVERVHADGSRSLRAVVRHPGAVAIIPLVDPEHVCLIKNHRVSVGQTLLEIPAGTLEQGEPPEVTAARELAEETGYQATSLERLTSFYLSPGVLDERMHLFVAQGLHAGPAHREATEEIENLITPWDDALAMIFDGRICDAKTIAGLLYYDRCRRKG